MTSRSMMSSSKKQSLCKSGLTGMELHAPPHWKSVDLISDLHLQAEDATTVHAWQAYLRRTSADAVFMLGDIFEVWVGDDSTDISGSFEAACQHTLRQAAQHTAIHLMHGNRDFLMGPAFAASCNAVLLDDPTILIFGNERTLLTHGDALCLDDRPYQQFRITVRSAEWQNDFLGKPLTKRQAIAKDLRQQSSQAQAERTGPYIDVDPAATLAWMQTHKANRIIHGHTHQPADHPMPEGKIRSVLTDWDLSSTPIRAEVLRLNVVDDGPLQVRRLPIDSPLL